MAVSGNVQVEAGRQEAVAVPEVLRLAQKVFQKPRATREREREGRRRRAALRAESLLRAPLIVVLYESREATLITHVRVQVRAHRRRSLVQQSVVETLVVCEVEALPLQLVLHVPIDFR